MRELECLVNGTNDNNGNGIAACGFQLFLIAPDE